MKIIKTISSYLILLALLLALLYCVDLIIGAVYNDIAPEFGQKNLKLALKEYKGITSKLKRRPHPYLTYENTPGYSKKDIPQHNNLGYRNTQNFSVEKPDSTIRILTLGGSTTYGPGVDTPAEAWPEQLQSILNKQLADSAFRVEVINGGLPWGSSAELLNHYLYRDRYLQPDIVILHTGGNDIGPLQFDNYTPEYTHWRTIRSSGKFNLRPGEPELIEASNIMKLIYAVWYATNEYATSKAYVHTRNAAVLSKEEVSQNIINNRPIGFSRYLDLLIRNIKLDGAIPVYFEFYQPMAEMFSEQGKKALEEANRKVNFTELLEPRKLALSKNIKVAKNICKSHNVEYLALNQGDIPVQYFIDNCHLNAEGQVFKAEFVNRSLQAYIKALTDKMP